MGVRSPCNGALCSGGFESHRAIYPPWDIDISVACVTEALQPPAGLTGWHHKCRQGTLYESPET